MSAITALPASTDSYFTKVRNWISSERTVQSAKVAFWFGGSFAAPFIPVPILNGAVMGAMIFMGSHEMVKHPDSVCMSGEYRPLVLSRTWKHLLAGATVSAVGWGVCTITLANGAAWGAFAALGGTGVGLRVAYSDRLCQGEYTRIETAHLPLENRQELRDSSANV